MQLHDVEPQVGCDRPDRFDRCVAKDADGARPFSNTGKHSGRCGGLDTARTLCEDDADVGGA